MRNVVVKFVEERAVASLSLRSIEVHSAGAQWQRACVEPEGPSKRLRGRSMPRGPSWGRRSSPPLPPWGSRRRLWVALRTLGERPVPCRAQLRGRVTASSLVQELWTPRQDGSALPPQARLWPVFRSQLDLKTAKTVKC